MKGTITITGNQEVGNRKGHGVVIQDTGRVVLDVVTGDRMSFAGGRKYSQWLLGEGIRCDPWADLASRSGVRFSRPRPERAPGQPRR